MPALCSDIHCNTWFRPVAIFTAEAVQDYIGVMEAVLALPPPKALDAVTDGSCTVPEAARRDELYILDMPKYQVGELTNDVFLEKWASREPFVLTGIIESKTPEELLNLKKTKGKHCTTTFYDGDIWSTARSTLGGYFKTWEKDQLPTRSLQIRVCPNASSHCRVHLAVFT